MATEYSEIVKSVDYLIEWAPHDAYPPVRAYMVIRAALLWVRAHQGDERAAEMAFRLGDEMATAKVPNREG